MEGGQLDVGRLVAGQGRALQDRLFSLQISIDPMAGMTEYINSVSTTGNSKLLFVVRAQAFDVALQV